MIKKTLYLLAAVVLFFLGFYFAKGWYNTSDTKQEVEASIILEQIQNVFKLVTVEGQFSEIYDETNYKEYTLFLPLPSKFQFPKTATLQVSGKVLVGYDMEGINIEVDSLSKTITLSGVPAEAEIIAVDHELSYKNLDESFFNSFKPADYTKLNKNAKVVLRSQAMQSTLFDKAKAEGNQMIEMIKLMAQSIGYKVVYEKQLVPQSSLQD